MATSFKSKFVKKSSSNSLGKDNISLDSNSSSSSSAIATLEFTKDSQNGHFINRLSKKFAKVTKFGRDKKVVEEADSLKDSSEKEHVSCGKKCEERRQELEAQSYIRDKEIENLRQLIEELDKKVDQAETQKSKLGEELKVCGEKLQERRQQDNIDSEVQSYRKVIEDLEKKFSASEKQKETLGKELKACGKRCEERRQQLEAQSVKIGEITSKLNDAKKDLECRDDEHQRRLKNLEEDHQRSREILLSQLQTKMSTNDFRELEEKLAQLEAIYKNQMEELSVKCSEAVSGLNQLNQSQLLSENLKNNHHVNHLNWSKNSSNDVNWLNVEEKTTTATVNEDIPFADDDAEATAEISTEISEVVTAEESAPIAASPVTDLDLPSEDENRDSKEIKMLVKEIEELKKDKELLRQEKADLEEKNDNFQVVIEENSMAIVSLSVQISELQNGLDTEKNVNEETTNELKNLKQTSEEQTHEINEKNEIIDRLEMEIDCHERSINQLNSEIKDLKSKLESVTDQYLTTEKKHKQLIEEKEKEFEAMQNLYVKTLDERKSIQEKYETEFEFLRNCHQEREQQLMEDFEWKLREIQKTSKAKQDELKNLQIKLKAEYEELVNKKDSQAETLYKQIEENDGKINVTETELRQLRGFTEELQKGMRVAANQVDQMRMLEIRFREELRDTRCHLTESKDTIAKLQKELADTKASCERRLKAKDVNLKKTSDEQLLLINQQWTMKLEKEVKRRSEELEIEYNNRKLNALEELANQKDQELASLMKKYENKTTDLSKQLSRVTSRLEERERQLTDELELAKMSFNIKLTEMQKTVDSVREDHRKTEIELKSKEKQTEELQMQLAAHRTTLDLVKEEANKQKESEIQQIKLQHLQQLDLTNQSWQEKLSNELEAQNQSHKMQIHNARIELEKLMQISKQKENEQLECISELKEAVIQRENSIKRLNDEMQRLQKGLSKMSQELEFHGKEILRVRNEASRQLRAASDGNFNKVKHDEDLTAIKQLREAVLDKDKMVKKLQEEKKQLYRQLQNHMTDYKRLSASQPVVSHNSETPKVNKRQSKSRQSSNRLSAPVILNDLEKANFIKDDNNHKQKTNGDSTGDSTGHLTGDLTENLNEMLTGDITKILTSDITKLSEAILKITKQIKEEKQINQTKPECPPEFIRIGSFCYFFGKTQLNWFSAYGSCKSKVAELAHPSTEEKNTQLVNYIKKNFSTFKACWWLGASDLAEEGTWIWTHDNSKLSFKNWFDNQPDNANGDENCLSYWSDNNWGWNDLNCKIPYFETFYICEQKLKLVE
ncbi:Fc fragment of IgE, low affinity II, receptor for (CD23) [Chamberlinius hualienensis]